jgi:hypothetical protein
MRITKIGTDYLILDESKMKDEAILSISKIHLLHLLFLEPTIEKINAVMTLFPKTNRFVVSNNIKIYNDVFKTTAKKYYVMNSVGDKLITFFRRNNKVLLNINNLSKPEREYVLCPTVLPDVLRNLEVVELSKKDFENVRLILNEWDGNVLIT